MCCIVGCESKDGHHIDLYGTESGLCAQKFVNHSSCESQHNKGDLSIYLSILTQRIFMLTINRIFIRAPKSVMRVALGTS